MPERTLAASWIAGAAIRPDEEAGRERRVRQGRRTAQALKDPLAQWATYLAVASAEIRAGDKSNAREDLHQAQAAAERVRNGAERDAALRYLATGYAEAGFYAQAREVAKAVRDKAGRSLAYALITGAQIRARHFDAARATAASIEGIRDRDAMCPAIAEGQAETGSVEGLEHWIGALPTPRLRARAFAAVACGLAEARRNGK